LDALAIEERVASLIHAVLIEGNRAGQLPHRAVERARECIASAPERNDTLADLAGAAHCSPFHLARTFRARTGETLHGLRTRLRMAESIARLADGENDLSTLAADLGYSSHSHFSAAFRRHFGTPPEQLRTNLTATSRKARETRRLAN
jgi:AraC-like DNA-binding protein